MTDPCELDQVESLLMETPPPLPWAGEGLKLQILREARRAQRQQTARVQLSSLAAACLLFCLISVGQFPLAGLTRTVTAPLASQTARPWFSPLDRAANLDGADIGTWKHVELVLQHQQRISQKLSENTRKQGTASRTPAVPWQFTHRAERPESPEEPWLMAAHTTRDFPHRPTVEQLPSESKT